PYEDENVKEKVKLYVLSLLNEKYGITERDFVRAEIEAVPSVKAVDVGFDRGLVGAYGHDDRVCAYTALMAELDKNAPEYTSLCVLTDKEETGSDGNTGLNS
ncbi:MAG: aminopeptidase, partial [Oscillospiraceae bacterium]